MKTLWCNSLDQKMVCFFRKRHHTAETAQHWVPGDPRTIFLATSFTQKMLRSSDSMCSSIFMLEIICYHNFT